MPGETGDTAGDVPDTTGKRRTVLRTKSIGAIISFLALILVFQFTVATGSSRAEKNKDVIIILDTSLSMVGQAQGRDIFDRAKSSIRDYIDQVRDGDRITFATFDTDVKIFPPVIVDDQNDRDILKKYITMTEASGLWTNTYQMIIKVLEFTNKLENLDYHLIGVGPQP